MNWERVFIKTERQDIQKMHEEFSDILHKELADESGA